MGETGHETLCGRMGAVGHDDGHSSRQPLEGVRDLVGAASASQDNVGRSLKDPCCDFIDLSKFPLGRVKFELHVLAVHVAKLTQTLHKGSYKTFPGIPLFGVEILA